MADLPALVLDDPSVASEEPRVLVGFPGLWRRGVPVAVADLGFENDDDVYARVDELGLPLTRTTVPEPPPSMLDLSAPEASEALALVNTVDELDLIEQEEHDGKARKTVLDAIAARREQLATVLPEGEG